MLQTICQSCGLPLLNDLQGRNADGTNNQTYCIYCYADGAFTQGESLEDIIEFLFLCEIKTGLYPTDEACRLTLRNRLSALDRWK